MQKAPAYAQARTFGCVGHRSARQVQQAIGLEIVCCLRRHSAQLHWHARRSAVGHCGRYIRERTVISCNRDSAPVCAMKVSSQSATTSPDPPSAASAPGSATALDRCCCSAASASAASRSVSAAWATRRSASPAAASCRAIASATAAARRCSLSTAAAHAFPASTARDRKSVV